MTVQIVAPGEYIVTLGNELPQVGRSYLLEDATNGSNAQNRAFHALLTEYWRTGLHSYPAKSFEEFRNCIKRSLGAGFEAFVYAEIVNGKPVIKDAKTYDEIPEHIRRDPDLKQLVRGRLKSWADYTKKERMETLDRLIAEMHEAGVKTKKFFEILEGMERAA